MGYADLHPWTELGDLPWQKQLLSLQSGEYTEQLQQSLCLARWDAELRKQKKNIFDQGVLVKNNFLSVDVQMLTSTVLEQIKNQGFTTIKIKMGRNSDLEIAALSRVAQFGLKLRLDFNGTGTLQSYTQLMDQLPGQVFELIEYVEDPFVFDLQEWQKAQAYAPLALDNQFAKVPWEELSDAPFAVIVLKPAKMDAVKVLELCRRYRLKLTVTSYMDHPIGVMHALGMAMELKNKQSDLILESGCLTHQLYQQDAFSAEMSAQGPYLQRVAGTGVGFDHLLEALPWQLANNI